MPPQPRWRLPLRSVPPDCLQLIFLAASGTRYATPVRVAFDRDIQELFCRALPGMIAQSGPQLLLVAGAVVASASPAAVSWIYFASRLIELPLGLVGAATGAVLIPRLSTGHADTERTDTVRDGAATDASASPCPRRWDSACCRRRSSRLLFEHGAFTAARYARNRAGADDPGDRPSRAGPDQATRRDLPGTRADASPAAGDAYRRRGDDCNRSSRAAALRLCRRYGRDLARRVADRDLARRCPCSAARAADRHPRHSQLRLHPAGDGRDGSGGRVRGAVFHRR